MPPSCSNYKFPELQSLNAALSDIRSKSDEKILNSLKKYEAGRVVKKSVIEYSTRKREIQCAFHLVLNERGLIAPQFRPFQRLYKHTNLSIEEEILSNDIKVINLHYLFCQHHGKYNPIESKYTNLLSNDEFDYDLASEYVAEKWTAETIANTSLSLDRYVQAELSTYRDQITRNHWKSINKSLADVKAKLNQHSRLPASRFNSESFQTRLDEYICLRLGNGSPKHAAQYYALKTGTRIKPGGEKNAHELMRKRKKFFEKIIDVRNW